MCLAFDFIHLVVPVTPHKPFPSICAPKKKKEADIFFLSNSSLPGCFRAWCVSIPEWIVLSVHYHIVNPEALQRKLNHRLFWVLFYELQNRVLIFKGKRPIPYCNPRLLTPTPQTHANRAQGDSACNQGVGLWVGKVVLEIPLRSCGTQAYFVPVYKRVI